MNLSRRLFLGRATSASAVALSASLPALADTAQIEENITAAHEAGCTPTDIAKWFQVARSSVYRLIGSLTLKRSECAPLACQQPRAR